MSLSSSNSRLKSSTKEDKKALHAACSKSDECQYGMVCALNEGKDIKECEKDKCQEMKEKSLVCLLKSNQSCRENKECYNNECVNSRCKPSAKKHMGSCSYHYFSEECEENTYCSQKGGDYVCLGGPGAPCEKDNECQGGVCGMMERMIKKTCLNIGERVLKSTVSYIGKGFGFGKKK